MGLGDCNDLEGGLSDDFCNMSQFLTQPLYMRTFEGGNNWYPDVHNLVMCDLIGVLIGVPP